MNNSRRSFFFRSLSSGGALCAFTAGSAAIAQTAMAVSDTDPQAVALGYKTDGSTTDTKKYPTYNASQSCSACVLFQGKPADVSASCAVFGNKLVAGKGWCSAWAKKV